MKVLVTGGNGQLGQDVIKELLDKEFYVYASDRLEPLRFKSHNNYTFVETDLTSESETVDLVKNTSPDVVIHCAAWTNVDAAEDEKNYEIVMAINENATRTLAEASADIGAKFIYISTDYVFDGAGEEPWKPDDTNYKPQNVYGVSKLAGERAVIENLKNYFIVRIAWVFGPYGNNFVKTMLSLSEKYESIKVVDDQIGTPTYTPDLAQLLVEMTTSDKYGIYHVTNEGDYISWAQFAQEIMKIAEKQTLVQPVSTAEYGLSKAKRPFNSRLNRDKLKETGFSLLPTWKDALKRYLRTIELEETKK